MCHAYLNLRRRPIECKRCILGWFFFSFKINNSWNLLKNLVVTWLSVEPWQFAESQVTQVSGVRCATELVEAAGVRLAAQVRVLRKVSGWGEGGTSKCAPRNLGSGRRGSPGEQDQGFLISAGPAAGSNTTFIWTRYALGRQFVVCHLETLNSGHCCGPTEPLPDLGSSLWC